LRELLAAVDDKTVAQIIGRNSNTNAVTWQNPDVMAAHATTQLCAHQSATLVDPDIVLAAAEGILNHALHLEKITFAHSAPCRSPAVNSVGPRTLARPGPGCNIRSPVRAVAQQIWLQGQIEPLMAFQSYLFDYNGVLVDDEAVHLAAFRDVLGPIGVSITDAEYQSKYLGFDDVGAFRAILEDHALPADASRVAALVEAKKPRYLERAKRELLTFPGAGALLNRLAESGATIGIVSGALRQEIELGLRVLGATSSVAFVVSAEDTTACKPDPEGYCIGLAKLRELVGTEPARRVLVVEDSLAGIEAARAAKIACLAVAHSYQADELYRAGPTQVVAKLGDIDDALLAALATRVLGNDAA